MTRRETEKQVREQMQQTITDKEALWARIESQLPEQRSEETPVPKIKRSVFRQALTVAACFLFVAAGLSIWAGREHVQTDSPAAPAADESSSAIGNDVPAQSFDEEGDEDSGLHYAYGGDDGDAGDEADAEAPAPGSAASPKNEEAASGQLTYDELQVEQNHDIANSVDRTLLSADGDFFSLAQVLEDTEVFADVTLVKAEQDAQTGEITYTLRVLDTFDGPELPDTVDISTSSPYILETAHRYVLPLSRTEGGWKLTCDSAPQMERTLDDKILLHNGWYLLTGNSVPVLCAQNGADDYFYDRMCLIDAETLETFLNNRAAGHYE